MDMSCRSPCVGMGGSVVVGFYGLYFLLLYFPPLLLCPNVNLNGAVMEAATTTESGDSGHTVMALPASVAIANNAATIG